LPAPEDTVHRRAPRADRGARALHRRAGPYNAASAVSYDILLALAAGALVPTVIALVLLSRRARVDRGRVRSLASARAQVTGLVESAMDPVISVDENQRVVLFNAAAEKVFRWPRSAVIGEPLDMLIPAEYRERHRAHVAQFGRTGVTSRRMGGSQVLCALRADGTTFPIEASISQHDEGGRRIYTAILRDITERLEGEERLARSEARLRGILDSAMDAIITVDEAQRIVLFNDAAEKMFGCPRAEALGAPLAWFIPERFRGDHAGYVKRFGDTRVTSRRMGRARIVTGLRRTGEEFPIDASISQLTESGNRFYTVILRDVSDLVEAEAEVRRSREELRELATAASSAREQEKTRIAREIHDELGQAMTTLKMDLSLIRVTTPDAGADLLARLDKMERQVDATIAAMRRIAADLRPLTLDDLGLVPAIESLVNNFTQSTGIPCELAVSQPEFRLTDAQATAVFRIVQEALNNAAKHAHASQVEVTLASDGSAINVTVRDNGHGCATAAAPRANAYGILGLRERAYLLGGEARITRAPGEGTEVDVTLPLQADTDAPAAAAQPADAAGRAAAGPRVTS
jgi:PAS domain S-box-containing protein